jgi:hypothetical protein
VVAEQLGQFRNQRMVLGNHLASNWSAFA